MLQKYLLEILGVEYENRILIFDFDNIEFRYSYIDLLKRYGFEILLYKDSTEFRYTYEKEYKNSDAKLAVIVTEEKFVPYDILKSFYETNIGWESLFPNLNKDVLKKDKDIDLNLLYGAYSNNFDDFSFSEQDSLYLIETMYQKENVLNYIAAIKEELLHMISYDEINYRIWLEIAEKKGRAEYYAAKINIDNDFTFVDEKFKEFIFNEYKTLSSATDRSSPVMVSRVMDYITNTKEKTALIILDGMSVADFFVLSSTFKQIKYEKDYIFAMVPTTTAISRQSLLAGKFPVQLKNPFSLSQEVKEFKNKCISLGYLDNQIQYERGFDFEIRPSTRMVSVVINNIDDIVHNQLNGRSGMYRDVEYLSNSNKIQKLISSLFQKDFIIYITSDHGNTICSGIGLLRNVGIEVQTKSKRALILKDFADPEELINKFSLLEYPGYYMKKNYKYLLCNTGTSLDSSGSVVMSHGGISIDEVIVPFIKIKAVHYG